MKLVKILYLLLLAAILGSPFHARAFPFNTDMFESEKLVPGTTVRTRVEGTVPLGSLAHRVAKKEDALTLVNPFAGDPQSAWRGKRLFEVNCSPCHGKFDSPTATPGSVAGKMLMAGPDLSQQFYKEKPDGLYYGTIHFGGYVFMPALGWKLSPDETWDIVTYLRSVQNR